VFVRCYESEACIEGNLAELRAAGARIARLISGEWAHFFCEWRRASEPGERYLVALEVTATEGPVRVGVRDDRLCVTGGSEHLHVFSEYFQFPNATEPRHTHFEWWDGYEHVHPDALPLVIIMS